MQKSNSIVVTVKTAAKNMLPGDELISASGSTLRVTCIKQTENRTIVLFDGDMEIDFLPYTQLKVYREEKS